mmetsp:Transcript_9391/g.22392  ORF Transcript_9391/g.22392 Transcript_9391/m.22392 type:complete len:220 (+) Transcript_9391:815-1474(+)
MASQRLRLLQPLLPFLPKLSLPLLQVLLLSHEALLLQVMSKLLLLQFPFALLDALAPFLALLNQGFKSLLSPTLEVPFSQLCLCILLLQFHKLLMLPLQLLLPAGRLQLLSKFMQPVNFTALPVCQGAKALQLSFQAAVLSMCPGSPHQGGCVANASAVAGRKHFWAQHFLVVCSHGICLGFCSLQLFQLLPQPFCLSLGFCELLCHRHHNARTSLRAT